MSLIRWKEWKKVSMSPPECREGMAAVGSRNRWPQRHGREGLGQSPVQWLVSSAEKDMEQGAGRRAGHVERNEPRLK